MEVAMEGPQDHWIVLETVNELHVPPTHMASQPKWPCGLLLPGSGEGD